MPTGKTIAECLQGLGVLEIQLEAQTRKQWPQNAKSLNDAIVAFMNSIEEESRVHDAGESLNNWIKERVAGWVQSNGERWSVKNRGMLFPHAPVLPKDESIIIYWIQQFVLRKWDNAIRNRDKYQASRSLPGLHSHGSKTTQLVNSDGHGTSMREMENAQASINSSESHELDGWDPYHEEEPDAVSSNSAAASVLDPYRTSPPLISNAVVPYESPDSQASQANERFQEDSSSTPATNDFRSRTYPLVTFQAEMYARTTFLVAPSKNRDGHSNTFYSRIMGLEEAQSADTFRAGVFERLGEMGEVAGSRRLVAKAEWLGVPFVVDNEHDHHYLMQTLNNLGKSKAQTCLCVVYVSLENEV